MAATERARQPGQMNQSWICAQLGAAVVQSWRDCRTSVPETTMWRRYEGFSVDNLAFSQDL
jgi:hypothetical protein